MVEVLSGFTVVWVIIILGFFIGRSGVLGPGAQTILSRTAFFVGSPALLFDTLSHADVASVLGPQLVVASASAFLAAGIYILIARFALARRSGSEIMIGGLSASMVNSANLGLPIAAYVLGDAALAAPVLIFQLAIYTPIYVAALDTLTAREMRQRDAARSDSSPTTGMIRVRHPSRWVRFWRQVGSVLRNPMIIGSLAGLLSSFTGWRLPAPVEESVSLLGGLSIPAMLIAFGMSLVGSKPLEKASGRRPDVMVASLIKLLVHPALAWLIAAFVFQMDGTNLLIAVVLGSLPAAQNVFVAASRYETGIIVAKDTILVTTIAPIPAMIAVAVLLA